MPNLDAILVQSSGTATGAAPRKPAWPRRMRMGLAVAAGLLASLVSQTALADFKICNRMSYVVEAALGIDMHAATATRGWFRLDPAQCRTVAQGDLIADRILLHARVLPVYGASPALENGGETLCVTQDNFVIAAARQCRGGQTAAQFTEVKPTISEGGDQTVYLAEDGDYDDEQARFAGIQRLLLIAGYDATPIDGVEGRKTQLALAAFLRNNNLSQAQVNQDGFFDEMIRLIEKPTGKALAWCNDTPHRIMAAIATGDGTTTVSRGWYRVEPGKCVHPDIDGQPKQIFSFAEAVDASNRPISFGGKPLNWGGPTILCTRESKFELNDHTDCRNQGFTPSGFIRINPDRGEQTVRFKLP